MATFSGAGPGSTSYSAAMGAPATIVVAGLTVTCSPGFQYIMTNTKGAFTATLPANPKPNDTIWISNFTTRADGTVSRNGNKIESTTQDITFDVIAGTLQLKYTNPTIGWIVVN